MSQVEVSNGLEPVRQSGLSWVHIGLGWNPFTNFNTDWFLTRLIWNLVHQPADKRVIHLFFIKLSFTFGSC